MKKLLLLISLFVTVGAIAQDSNILIGSYSPAWGVRIKANFTGSGAWSRGYFFANQDNTSTFFGLGAFGTYTNNISSMTYGWIGADYNQGYMYFLPNGNIGIGTTNPSGLLHLGQNDGAEQVVRAPLILSRYWGSDSNTRASSIFHYKPTGGSDQLVISVSGDGGSYSNPAVYSQAKMVVQANGNVGIGTTSPSEKISIIGSTGIYAGLNNASPRPAVSAGTIAGEVRGVGGINSTSADDGFLRLSAGGGTNSITKSFIDLSGYMANTSSNDRYQNIIFGTSGTERVRIDATGNVGIGTTNTSAYKLSVNGNIRTQDVTVTTTGWPDYVFQPEYQLPSLEALSVQIKAQGHLPNIPSAAEVSKNGIALGEMNKKLLEKVEELTLYAIKQNNEIKTQNEESKQQKELLQKQAEQIKTQNEALKQQSELIAELLQRIEKLENKK